MTTTDKLTYIRASHEMFPHCRACKLTRGATCPEKPWKDWTDEEIETAYAILFYHTPSYAEEQLEHAMKKKNEMEAKPTLENSKQKIRTHFAEVKLGGTPAKPFFYIAYYDPTDEEYYEGFGSYDLRNVEGWLRDEFEIVDKPPVKEPEFVKAGDSVEHPLHYTQNGIECIEAIKASMTSDGFMDYCKGNVLKYIWRWRDKGGVQDLEKARVYLNWMIEEAKK